MVKIVSSREGIETDSFHTEAKQENEIYKD